MAKEKYAIKWHEGIKVPSDEFPSHREGMWIEVPPRVKRKHARKILRLGQRAALKPQLPDPERPGETMPNPDYLEAIEASDQILQVCLEIGFRWNWEDGAGNPLPQPCDDPSVLEEISGDELDFITDHMRDGTKIPPPKPIAS